jgi:ketosteroid isomerase-like protein
VTASKSVPVAVTSYFDALNDEDWDGFRSLWAEDAAVLAVGARPRYGVDDVMSLYKRIFKHWSRHLDVPGRTLIADDTVTVEVHFVGTTNEGREVEFDAVDVIDLEGGRIKRITTWYDTARVLALIAGTLH